MDNRMVVYDGNLVGELRFEDDEEDFRSCCCEVDDEAWKEIDEPVKEETEQELDDEFSVKMFFKGVSLPEAGGSGSGGLSGIGVVMERSADSPVIQIQKKLDFYVEESVADYLALMDGLKEAMQNQICRVYAFTDSESLFDQVANNEKTELPLQLALRERISEHTSNLETFSLKLVPSVDVDKPLKLAQIAIGIVSTPTKGEKPVENCSICCEDKPFPVMITINCSHKFCSHCMKTYVDGKVQSSQVPIRCPQLQCKYYITATECKSFLPHSSYESLDRALAEANIHHSDRMYCPFPNCSALLNPRECLSARASSSSQSDNNNCIECPVCQRFICVECEVPWHSSLSCEEYQSLPEEERDSGDITLHLLAQNKRWRRCQQCRRMIELTQGCYHMTCWCGHEFCYSCGAEYTSDGQQCQCAFWDDDNSNDLISQSVQESEQWAWETFNSLPMLTDAYSEQERSQLALIQRFLAGGFSLSDLQPYQPPPPPPCTDSYVDAMKDLHQLPWLERFVSVISDEYYEDYIQ
ncbi:hypothetical protein ACFE04_031054 [Oxalis oulophora]